MINAQTKCPTCGTPCTVISSGLQLVENSGDETLAIKHYHPLPSFEEIHCEKLEEERRTTLNWLRELKRCLFNAPERQYEMSIIDDLLEKAKLK